MMMIAAIAGTGAAVGLLKAADTLNPCRPVNLRDLGRQIAEAVVERDGELAV